MKQLQNNSLKKIALVLAAAMLLIIPNLSVYSSIGSYQTTSRAITTNNKHLISNNNKNEKPIIAVELAMVAGGFAFMVAAIAYFAFGSTTVAVSCCVLSPREIMVDKILSKNYNKYDFSGFDN